MRKVALYGDEARAKVLAGVTAINNAVKVTLGPLGRNVLISTSKYDQQYVAVQNPVHITKDGYTVSGSFDVDDYHEKTGVLMVQEAAQKTVDQAGDGTTTTVVLLEAIVRLGMEAIKSGATPIQLKREIDAAVIDVVAHLKERAIQIDSNERIFNIATISANNDPEIGRLISDAFEKIGRDGMIDIEAGKGLTTEVKIAGGYRFGRGWLSHYFVTDRNKQICEMENPLILMYEKMITHHTQIIRAVEISLKASRPLLIICEDAKEEGMGFVVGNVLQGRAKICIVKSPGFGDLRSQEMEDIALLTGGTYMTDSKGTGIAEIELANFGSAKKVTISKEETIIVGGTSDAEQRINIVNQLFALAENAKAASEEDRPSIEARIARLKGGIAIIQVGGPTETEMKERLDRFDDAVRATKSAIAEGYVPGGGLVFRNLSVAYSGSTGGKGVVFKALLSPYVQICDNAGKDYMEVWREADYRDVGYNAKEDRTEDLVEAGIIDPVKVLRCALQNAASAATMILTTECLIADLP